MLFLAWGLFRPETNPAGHGISVGLDSILFIAAIFIPLSALRSRLVLEGNRIEVQSALQAHSADKSEIEGFRRFSSRNNNGVRLYLKDNRGTFMVSSAFSGKEDFEQWLHGIPDLDERDAQEVQRQFTQQQALSADGNTGGNSRQQAAATMIGLNIALILTVLAMFFAPPPLRAISIFLLLIFPLVAALLVYSAPLLFTFFKRKPDPRSDLTLVVAGPSIALILSYSFAAAPAHIVEPFSLAYLYVGLFVFYAVLLAPIVWKAPTPGSKLFALFVFGAIYGIFAVNAVDTVPDRSVPDVFQTVVFRKYVTHGRSTHYYLRLAPWGPVTDTSSVAVSNHLYHAVNVGDQVCVQEHPGFLHAPWYTVSPCSEP